MKKQILAFLLIAVTLISGQGSGGTDAKFEYRYLIDLPTAGILEKGYAGISTDFMPFGTVVTKLEVGVFENFSFGISYGGSNIIGTGKVTMYELPGVNVRGRLFDETESVPAITIGFDSQGKGFYDKNDKRYELKSPGLFIAASKNFEFLGYISFHGLLNYSFERQDGDKDLNMGLGIEKTIGTQVSIIGEYDFAINDNGSKSIGDGSGYLNLGIRWTIGSGLTIGLNLRDMLSNKKLIGNKADRGLYIEFVRGIF